MPRLLFTSGKDLVPIVKYRRLGGPQGRSGQVWKISPPPGFDPRTVQPVASRYTDYITRPQNFLAKHKIPKVRQPLYLLDLAPCNFFLFVKIKPS